MAKDGDTSFNNNTPSQDDSDTNKSFVKKVKSRVSGFLPSSLTRWFGSTESQVRYREESDDEEDDDDESFQIQPPAKRIKSNDTTFQYTSTSSSSHSLDGPSKSRLNNVNHVETKLTFPEPIPGPSGYKPRKNVASGKSALNKQLYSVQDDVANGDKYSDSGESVTSGYSSMLVGSKDAVNENKTETVTNDSLNDSKFIYNPSSKLNNRSLFGDRCMSPQQSNQSLSARQPSFNSSVFGSPNFVDRTLASKKILNSPFYSGRTTYGGASAYGRSLASLSSDYKSLRNSIQIKPVNDATRNVVKTNTTLSKTARRILDTLEQYTTPISDAKKIPNPTNPNRKKYLASANPYAMREKVPSNRELQVPTVPDLLKMKLKERLQDSTVTVRQLANSSKSVLNREEYKIRTLDHDDDSVTKHTNKMRTKISSARQKNEPHRTMEEVKLPDIQLPITTLPKFDFSLPTIEPVKNTSSPVSKTIETVKISTNTLKMVEKVTDAQKNVESKKTEVITLETRKKDNKKTETNRTENKASEYVKMTEFVFSDPLVIAENLKSIHAINNFIFSEPNRIDAKHPSKDTDLMKQLTTTTKNNGEKPKKDLTAASLSTLDTYKRDANDLMAKFKPSEDMWECSVCLIRNVNSKSRCAACETPRLQETGKKNDNSNKNCSVGFGDKFKMTTGQWECKVCLVVNPLDKNKCVACESPKQQQEVKEKIDNKIGMMTSEMWECKTCLVRNKNSEAKCAACTTPRPVANGPLKPELKSVSHGFGSKFAPPPDTWSCDVCAIRNKNDIPKCVACESPRPAHIKPAPPSGGFGDSFKRKDNQWECGTCMVRNSEDKERCQCCDALKPSAFKRDVPKDKTPISLFNFGIDPNAKLTAKGFTFGIKPSENNTETTAAVTTSIFGQNAPIVSTSAIATSTSTVPAFTFGVKPTQEKSEDAPQVPKIQVVNVDTHDRTIETEKPAETLKVPPVKLPEFKSTFTSKEDKKDEKKEEHNILNGETKPSTVLFGIPSNSSESPATSNIFAVEVNPMPTFAFGANPKANPVSTSSSSIFGANPSQTTTAVFKTTKPVVFGTQATPTPTPAAPPAFGATTGNLFNSPTIAVDAPASSVPAFGKHRTDEQPPPAKVPMFSFGQGNKPETEQPKFGFGALQSSSTSGIFNFGQSAAQPNLNFNAGSNNSGASTTTTTAVNFEGANTNQNGGANAPIFNFGVGANATPKTGFNFGATPTQSQQTASAGSAPPPNPGMFNFGFSGSTPASVPAPGAYNFSGNTATEFKPNFNFTATGQPPTFNAQSTPGDKSSRVIRKAVRRAHR